jgi:hypothetical protein
MNAQSQSSADRTSYQHCGYNVRRQFCMIPSDRANCQLASMS